MYNYFIIYKPYGVISQFTLEGNHPTLASIYDFPKDVYPIGRLDTDSEGLLLLSNDKELTNLLLHPTNAHKRTYLVQVEGTFSKDAANRLAKGVDISINGKKHHTLPTIVKIIPEPKSLPERNPPIRFRQNIPTSWIEITLTEGKNRQVRRMTAAVGFPTLRLIRYSMGKVNIDKMQPGDIRMIDRQDII